MNRLCRIIGFWRGVQTASRDSILIPAHRAGLDVAPYHDDLVNLCPTD
jgi:hypothetical protein